LAIGLVGALAVAACSGDDDDGDEPAAAADEDAGTADADDDDGDDAELDAALERAEAAEAEAEAAEAEAEVLATELSDANEQVAELESAQTETVSELETLAESETIRADNAEAEVQEFSDLFPVVVESTLAGIELDQEGTWNLDWHESYCDFDFCPLTPTTPQATFARTPEDFLRVVVPGVLDAGIFAVDGSLYAIVDSDTTALPPCPDGTPRDTRVTMTVYADDIRVNLDGSREVTGLEGAITLDARTNGDCTGGVAFYGVEMSRAG